MSLPSLALSPAARISCFAVGREASPILVVDDAFAGAEAIAAYGRTEAVFGTPATAYPGLNATLSDDAFLSLIEDLRSHLNRVYAIPDTAPVAGTGYFGLVSLKPEDLTPGQSIPHVDNIGDRGLAAVAYFCDESFGGTGFYRHRATGFERLTRDNIMTYDAVLATETRQGLPQAYTVGDHVLFECIGTTEARFNRLVLYNCNLLHSGQVDPARLSADPAKGRLTLNAFLAPI